MNDNDFSILLGVTLKSVEFERVTYRKKEKYVETKQIGAQVVRFTTDADRVFEMCHHQDCCEDVQVEDVCGEVSDLIGTPILLAECVTSKDPPAGSEVGEEDLWTFYKLVTINGAMTIRWHGSSNGYYGIEVSFGEKVK